ncbi:MAG: rubrerythrin [Thermoplasmata archaeon HGW-Thermoplasmata-1]|nr:MAG: rubrerythrin [Thermoplasmata archaeon HGW-Thermoplasmata-1]
MKASNAVRGDKMDVFDYALKIETDGENYYRELAQKSNHEGFANILSMLADEEVKHREALVRMRNREKHALPDSTVLKNARAVLQKLRDMDREFDFSMSELDLYKKALELEAKSQELYEKSAMESEDEHEQGVLLKMAKEEEKHFYVLENILEFVSRPESWTENPEFHHTEDY